MRKLMAIAIVLCIFTALVGSAIAHELFNNMAISTQNQDLTDGNYMLHQNQGFNAKGETSNIIHWTQGQNGNVKNNGAYGGSVIGKQSQAVTVSGPQPSSITANQYSTGNAGC